MESKLNVYHSKTAPDTEFTEKDLSEEYKNEIEEAADVLDELWAYSTTLLRYEALTSDSTRWEKIAVLSFFRRVVKLIDGIRVLIRAGSVEACEPLLRSLLETGLSFEYLIKEDTPRRALCYIYFECRSEIEFLEEHRPEHKDYEKIKAHYKNNSHIITSVSDLVDNTERLEVLRKQLQLPEFSPIKKESKKASNPKKWYRLFSDINNFAKLATHLNKFDLYDILYENWSNYVHGTKSHLGIFKFDEDGNVYMYQPQILNELYNNTILTTKIGVIVLEAVVKYRVKDKEKDKMVIGNHLWWH